MPRYFIAIPLPDEARNRLVAVQPPALPGMRILARDELHLTLHFLGELPAHDVETVRTALRTIKVRSFAVTIQGVGMFPSERHAKVLWAGVAAKSDLIEFHRAIGAVLTDAIGYKPEDRPYSPHVTLARLDEPAPPEVIDRYLDENREFVIPHIPIDRFALFSSRFEGKIPKYEEEAVIPLPQFSNSWQDDIRIRFPYWLKDEALSNWPAAKASLAIGREVSGVVIARAPFGVWLDIATPFPALLLVPNMRQAEEQRIAFDDYPQIGEIVTGRINALGDRGEIGITQRNPVNVAGR